MPLSGSKLIIYRTLLMGSCINLPTKKTRISLGRKLRLRDRGQKKYTTYDLTIAPHLDQSHYRDFLQVAFTVPLRPFCSRHISLFTRELHLEIAFCLLRRALANIYLHFEGNSLLKCPLVFASGAAL